MAVSVDTVYQRVLALANKEQRGYITPQEFNLLANPVQMSKFEFYFYLKLPYNCFYGKSEHKKMNKFLLALILLSLETLLLIRL